MFLSLVGQFGRRQQKVFRFSRRTTFDSLGNALSGRGGVQTREHRAEKWTPVFGKKRCGNKKLYPVPLYATTVHDSQGENGMM
jgi:hypothetical protein